MAFEQVRLSCGIEIEALFVFHEELMQDYLHCHQNGTGLIKDVGDKERNLRSKHYPTNPYRSWAVRTDEALDGHTDTIKTGAYGPMGFFRAYKSEPMGLAREILLNEAGIDDISTKWIHRKQQEYNGWTLANECSVPGVEKGVLAENLIAKKPLTIDTEEWDSSSIELISPPSQDLGETMNHVNNILKTLSGDWDTGHGLFVNETCGFHVHVGQPHGESFSLTTIQHLAWLLVVFEDAINCLHAPHRRTDRPSEEIRSMRDFWICDEPRKVSRRAVVDQSTGELKNQKYECYYCSLSEIENDIFNVESDDPEEKAVQRLVKGLNSSRCCLVNFLNITKPERPNTIEFRQHVGTLSTEDMKWWVEFCQRITQAAYQIACGYKKACPRLKDWVAVIKLTVDDLFDLIDFPEEGRTFYKGKVAEYGEFESSVFTEYVPFEDEVEDVEEQESEPVEAKATLLSHMLSTLQVVERINEEHQGVQTALPPPQCLLPAIAAY
ncbi:MAG: hypothetical protein M1831_002790 [Alyxoria varia]|nr:MAG: hypothetical protein M1831_002790 [Alyxoria varia]